MLFSKRKLRPAIKRHGGKAYLARWIIGYFPDHDTYVEPYGGGLNVLLNKPRCPVEVAGDTNGPIVNLYRVLADDRLYAEFKKALATVEYREDVFEYAKAQCVRAVPEPSVRQALFFLVKNRMSRSGHGKDFAWSERKRGGRPGDLNAWETLKARDIDLVAQRLRGVHFYHAKALAVMPRYAGPRTLYYLDPPYPDFTRTDKDTYEEDEMTVAEHEDMLKMAVRLEARGLFISTYWNDLYHDYLKPAGWDYVDKDMPNHSGQGETKQRRREILWYKKND